MSISVINPSTSGVGGLDTQVQFNDNNVIAGDSGLTYNKTTDTLTVSGSVIVPLIRPATTGNVPLILQPAGDAGICVRAGQFDQPVFIRGQYAIDLQFIRTNSSQTASGIASFIAGQQNTASGPYSIALGVQNTSSNQASVALGSFNTASGTYSFAGGDQNVVSGYTATALGSRNTASGQYGVSLGLQNAASATGSIAIGIQNSGGGSSSTAIGVQNNASGPSSIAIGEANQATGFYSTAIGTTNRATGAYSVALGRYASTKLVDGLFCIATTSINSLPGITQTNIFNCSTETTNATPTILKSSFNAIGATNQLAVQNNSCLAFTGIVVATVTGGGDAVSWKFEGMIQRGIDNTTTALINPVTPTIIAQKPGASTWLLSITADTVNGCLAVTFIGQTNKIIRVNCTIYASEVAF